MYVTDDDCQSSRPIPLPPGISDPPQNATAVDGVLIAAFYRGQLFTSSDDGRTWTSVAVPYGPLATDPRFARLVFLALSQRLLRSTDRGATWTQLAPDGPPFHDVVEGGTSFYATARGGIWRSRDSGHTWTRAFETR